MNRRPITELDLVNAAAERRRILRLTWTDVVIALLAGWAIGKLLFWVLE